MKALIFQNTPIKDIDGGSWSVFDWSCDRDSEAAQDLLKQRNIRLPPKTTTSVQTPNIPQYILKDPGRFGAKADASIHRLLFQLLAFSQSTQMG